MKSPDQLTIRYRAVSELVRYGRNARQHSQEQIEQIKESLRKFGWTNPALVAGDDLLAGHGRLEAATQMWAAGVPKAPRIARTGDEMKKAATAGGAWLLERDQKGFLLETILPAAGINHSPPER